MKKLMTIAACAALLVGLTGCLSVPSTEIGINPKTGLFSIKSPKDIEMTNVFVTVEQRPDGSKEIKTRIGGYSSKNSPDVLAAVAGANARMSENMLGLGKLMMEGMTKGAVEGMLPGVKAQSDAPAGKIVIQPPTQETIPRKWVPNTLNLGAN